MKKFIKLFLITLVILPCFGLLVACDNSDDSESTTTYLVTLPSNSEGTEVSINGMHTPNSEGKYEVDSNNNYFNFQITVKEGYDFAGEELYVKANDIQLSPSGSSSLDKTRRFQSDRDFIFSAQITQDTNFVLDTEILLKELDVSITTSELFDVRRVTNGVAGDIVTTENNTLSVPYGDSFMLDYKLKDSSREFVLEPDTNNSYTFVSYRAEVYSEMPSVRAYPIRTNSGSVKTYDEGFTRIKFIVKEDFSTKVPDTRLIIHDINYFYNLAYSINQYQPSGNTYVLDNGKQEEIREPNGQTYFAHIREPNQICNAEYLYFGVSLSSSFSNSITSMQAQYKLDGEETKRNATKVATILDQYENNIVIYKTPTTITDDVTLYVNNIDLNYDYFKINYPDGFQTEINLNPVSNKNGIILNLNDNLYIKKGINYTIRMKVADSSYSLHGGNPTLIISGENSETKISAPAILDPSTQQNGSQYYVYEIDLNSELLADFTCDELTFTYGNIKKDVCSVYIADSDKLNYSIYGLNNYEEYITGEDPEIVDLEFNSNTFNQDYNTTKYYLVTPNDGYYFHNICPSFGYGDIEILKDSYGFIRVFNPTNYENSLIMKLTTTYMPSIYLYVTSDIENALVCDDSTTEKDETDLILQAPIESPAQDPYPARYYKMKVYGSSDAPSDLLTLPAETYYNKDFYITLHNPRNINLPQFEYNNHCIFDLYLSWKADENSPIRRVKLERGQPNTIYASAFKVSGLVSNATIEVDFINDGSSHRGSNDTYIFDDKYTYGTTFDKSLFENTEIRFGLNTYDEDKMVLGTRGINLYELDGSINNLTSIPKGAGPQDILYIKVTAKNGYCLNNFYLSADDLRNSSGFERIDGGPETGYFLFRTTNLSSINVGNSRRVFPVSNETGTYDTSEIICATTTEKDNKCVFVNVEFNSSAVDLKFDAHTQPEDSILNETSKSQVYLYGDTCRFELMNNTYGNPYNFSNAQVYVSTQIQPLVPEVILGDDNEYHTFYSFTVDGIKANSSNRETIYITYSVDLYDTPCKIDVTNFENAVDNLVVNFNDSMQNYHMGNGKAPVYQNGTNNYYLFPNGFITLLFERSEKFNYTNSKIMVNGNNVPWPAGPTISETYYQLDLEFADYGNNVSQIDISLIDYIPETYTIYLGDELADCTVEFWDNSIGEDGAYVVIPKTTNAYNFNGGDVQIRISDFRLQNDLYLYSLKNGGINDRTFRRVINDINGIELSNENGTELILNNVFSDIVIGTQQTTAEQFLNPLLFQ